MAGLVPVSLFILLAGAARAAADLEPAAAAQNSSRYPRAATLRFLQLISGYDDAVEDDWALRSLLSAPARRRESDRASSVPLVLLPVAVQDSPEHDGYNVRPPRRRVVPQYGGRPADYAPHSSRRRPAGGDGGDGEEAADVGPFDNDDAPDFPRRRPAGAHGGERGRWADAASFDEDAPAPARRRPADRAWSRPPPTAAVLPIVAPVESSQRLVEMFRAQAPSEQDAAQPAILQSGFDASERVLLPDFEDDDAAPPPLPPPAPQGRARRASAAPRPAPAPLRLARPLKLRAVLTVPRAGYSEPYTAWWEPGGDARVHLQDGATVTLRKALPGGRVRKVEMHVDRADGRVVRRCARAEAAAGGADRAHPALPDLQLFTFAGYGDDGAERWQHRAAGAAGAAGGARGEALTARHELLLRRDADGSILPIRYSVAVDSSVLGADCDGYQHRYLDVSYHARPPDFYEANLDELCDEVRALNASEPSARARLEPLREFTLPQRDARYDAILERFKARNERRYADDAEEAVRKNLLMQSSRFTESGNRAGATFQLGLNFLGDRLDAELPGGAAPGGGDDAERFPHARPALPALERRLPAAFDWRERGGVTPVRFQGMSCQSCWAFAVAGAVEGALFARSGHLASLSEQQLVDCAHAFGARGCVGTWPSRAYDYVQARGLAALDDYTPYKGKVESCEEGSVAPVTLISGHVNVTKHSVPALQVAIRQHGPAVVIVDSSHKSFAFYKKGVLYDDRCSKKSAKHAVLAVGWGQQKGEPHFILKNSWSEAWGERGYVRLQARANTCGVLTYPSYPRLEDGDVLQS